MSFLSFPALPQKCLLHRDYSTAIFIQYAKDITGIHLPSRNQGEYLKTSTGIFLLLYCP